MNGWTIAFIALLASRFGTAWVNHGNKRQEKFCYWNGWMVTFRITVEVLILWKAGLFG